MTLDEAIETAHQALDIDKEILNPAAYHGYIIIDIPKIGPRVYSDVPQAPGGLLPPAKRPKGEVIATVDKNGNVARTGPSGDKFFDDGLYACPWLCPINIHPEDVEYHKQYHRDQTPGENPDVRGEFL